MREYTKWCLQEVVGWQEFEDICADYLYRQGYQAIRQAGRYGDGGRDAVILYNRQESVVFAFSMEKNPVSHQSSKFYREYSKWEEKALVKFVFVSNQDIGSGKIDIEKQLTNPPVTIYDITDLVRFLDLHDDGEKIKRKYGIEGNQTTVPRTAEKSQESQKMSPRYNVHSLRDSSHGQAKRYVADVLLNGVTAKQDILEIIKEVTFELRTRKYHRNEILKKRWVNTPAHVIWLFVYPSFEDVKSTNWICRTQWISQELAPEFAPMKLSGEESSEHIIVDWNTHYEFMSQYSHDNRLTKEDYLEQMERMLESTKKLIEQAIDLTNKYTNSQLSEQRYIQKMQKLEKPLTDLFFQAGDIGFASTECTDLDDIFQSLIGRAHDIALYFSEKGLETWEGKNRDFLVRSTLKEYDEDLVRFGFELEKIL